MLAAAVLLLALEMATAGLFSLPFAVGAGAAAAAGFAGVGVPGQLVICLIVSAISFLALRPLAHRLDKEGITEGIGALRLINEVGLVVEPIPAGGSGMVRISGEKWRARTEDYTAVAEGQTVRILEVQGTRLVVVPADQAPGDQAPARPPTDRPSP